MPGAIDLKARGVGGRKGSQFAAGGQTRLIILIKYYYIYNHSMGKQPVQGQKKSKDAIAKAASQTKAGVKVPLPLFLEMDQGKSQRESR